MFSLRPATAEDFPSIRKLVFDVRINPMGLDWRRFVLACAESTAGECTQIVGCGQVKPHKDGSWELASIAVAPEWRGHGAARAVIERLIALHFAAHPGQPLHLTCRSHLGPLYEKFGFRAVGESEMPPYFRNISRLARLAGKIGLIPADLLVMCLGAT